MITLTNDQVNDLINYTKYLQSCAMPLRKLVPSENSINNIANAIYKILLNNNDSQTPTKTTTNN